MSEVLIPSAVADVCICAECVDQIHAMLKEYRDDEHQNGVNDIEITDIPKPKEINDFLNKYVIGQDAAKNTYQ